MHLNNNHKNMVTGKIDGRLYIFTEHLEKMPATFISDNIVLSLLKWVLYSVNFYESLEIHLAQNAGFYPMK